MQKELLLPIYRSGIPTLWGEQDSPWCADKVADRCREVQSSAIFSDMIIVEYGAHIMVASQDEDCILCCLRLLEFVEKLGKTGVEILKGPKVFLYHVLAHVVEAWFAAEAFWQSRYLCMLRNVQRRMVGGCHGHNHLWLAGLLFEFSQNHLQHIFIVDTNAVVFG